MHKAQNIRHGRVIAERCGASTAATHDGRQHDDGSPGGFKISPHIDLFNRRRLPWVAACAAMTKQVGVRGQRVR